MTSRPPVPQPATGEARARYRGMPHAMLGVARRTALLLVTVGRNVAEFHRAQYQMWERYQECELPARENPWLRWVDIDGQWRLSGEVLPPVPLRLRRAARAALRRQPHPSRRSGMAP